MIKINTITYNKAWYRYLKNPENFIEKKIICLNKKYKKYKKKEIYCTLLLSNDREIKKLNKKFRKKNKSTDVLSFPFYSKKNLQYKLRKDKEVYLGDIIINLSKINEKRNTDFELEFNRLWVHGLVHLFGYDHKKNKDFHTMARFEKKILSYLN